MDNNLYSIKANVVKADIGTMSLVYLPDKQTFFVLNKTAGLLFTILEQGKSKKNLIKALDILYPKTGKRTKERHVNSFIHLITDHELAEPLEKGHISFEKIALPDIEGELETPIISAYEKKWILEHHPDAIYDVQFGDIWDPASSGV